MTIAYPDVSNHEGAMALQSGTVACFAKSSEGTGYTDPYYLHFKAEAARVGALFGAYHFLRQGDGAGQAGFAYSIVGPRVPLMIDFEPEYDANGSPISLPSLADAVAFRDTYRELGGLVRLNYLPHWYWAGHLGSPSLAPLADLALVSSGYTTYSDTGPGWASYGGLEPQIWQYTDKLPYSGRLVDFNAYRGTVQDFAALLGLSGGSMTPEQEAELLNQSLNVYDGLFFGGTSMGATPPGAKTNSLVDKLDYLITAVGTLAAPVDVKALAATVVAGLTPAIDAAIAAGQPVDYDKVATVVEQHLAATLAAAK